MAEMNISFSKIVSFPRPLSWSQVYNAGKLFAVVSLKRRETQEQELSDELNQLGKSVLDKLEEEFFIIEAKNLSTIKQAITSVLQNLPEEVGFSFAAAVVNNNVLYLFGSGGAKVFIKRNGKFGTILDSDNLDSKAIVSSSGPLEGNDLIILATKPFLDIIDLPLISSSLTTFSPDEIAETLTPKAHEKEEGGAAAFIIKYTKQDQVSGQPQYEEEKTEKKTEISLPVKNRFSINLTHSKKVYLTIAIVILIILSSSIFFAVKKQSDTKNQAIFKEIYSAALKKYEEGSNLFDLNTNLAKENLFASKELLEDNKSKFTEGSEEQKQISELLKKVDEELEDLNKEISFFLKTQIDNPKASFFAQDENFVYILDSNGISSLDKKNGKTQALIESNSWKKPLGIAAYLGNLYVIDKGSNQILKFIAEGDGFTKSNYFGDSPPNLSNAVSMSIDGSIWILFKDGSIQKFIRGTKEEFSLSGIDKSLSSPTRIFTQRDIDNVYILDNDNSRVVVIGKDGNYRTEYSHYSIKNAKDFEVLQKDKKIYILSQNKSYEIELK